MHWKPKAEHGFQGAATEFVAADPAPYFSLLARSNNDKPQRQNTLALRYEPAKAAQAESCPPERNYIWPQSVRVVQLPYLSSDQSRSPKIENVGLFRDRDYLWRCALVQVKCTR